MYDFFGICLFTGRVCDELVHASDWLPTLYAVGGGNIRNLGKIDGYNIWEALSDGAASPRFEVLHGVDTLTNVAGALRVGDYKLIVNQDDSFYGDWYPRPGTSIPIGTNKRKRRQLLEGTTVDCTIREPHPLLFTHAPVCKPREKPCLFNIKWDPCEYHNIAEIMPNTMKVMLERFNHFANTSAQPIYPESDNSSKPDLHDGSWTFWRDNPKIPSTNANFVYPDPMADLKMNNDGGSSSPFTPPDNEKIFKEKAKHVKPFVNVTGGVLNHKPRNATNIQKAAHHAPHHPKPPPPPPPPPPALPPPVYHVSSPKHTTKVPVLHPHVMQHHDKPRKPTVQRVRPNIVIEGIGNLIDANNTETVLIPNNIPYVPTKAPFVPTDPPFFAAPTDTVPLPLPTESAINIDFLKTTSNPYKAGYFTTTDKPAIDIQNMLMEDLGSGMVPTTPPEQNPSAFQPVKVMKPLSLGDYVSGRPHGSNTHGGKISGDKSLGAKLHSKEMMIDLPQVYDVIDETDNLPDNQGSKGTGGALNVFDVIDQKGTKATSNKNSAKKIESDTGSGVGIQSPLSTFFKPKPHADKPKSNFVPKTVKVQTPGKLSPVAHNFEGDIVMDGHQFHIKGTETGDTEWLLNDARRQGAAVSDKPIVVQHTEHHSTPKPKSNVPKKPADNEETVDSHHFSEVTDIIDETPEQDVVERKQKPKHAPVVVAKKPKAKQVVVKPKQNVVKKPQPITSVPKSLKKAERKEETKIKPLARVHANGTDITKKNDTNCEKPTQLESSDNAVVVSSVVIVVIASAMVVGVALVAMIAVVARHFQKPKNRDGAGTS